MIISQHHELPEGNGFPNALHHTRIAPLSALFIVAHDFLFYFERTKNANLVTFAKEQEHRYTQGHFKKILRKILNDQSVEEAA
jgi:response regulator RpfG family c-di-GMP phosphodiesterase